jgi:hypothetical protein
MSAVYWPLILGIAAFVLLNFCWAWWRRERAIKHAEAEYNSGFEYATERPRLENYLAILQGVLPSHVISSSPLHETTLRWESPIGRARAAVAFAAARFALALPPVEVVITPHIADDRDAELNWDAPWEVVLDGECASLRPLADSIPNWRIRVREEVVNDLDRLCVVAAHEVAHLLLFAKRIRLTPNLRNEELTDAAVVLAGFGPIMERVAYSVVRQPVRHGVFAFTVRRSCYLHREAIRFLCAHRMHLAAPAGQLTTARLAVT